MYIIVRLTHFFFQKIAKFHALCIVIRRLRPELFNAKMSPHLMTVATCMNSDKKLKVHILFSVDFIEI